jgi:hypothetical protein
MADALAKEVVGPDKTHIFHQLVSARKRDNWERMIKEWEKEWQSTENGKHLRRINDGLPSKCAQRIYAHCQGTEHISWHSSEQDTPSWQCTPNCMGSLKRISANAGREKSRLYVKILVLTIG